MRVCGKWLFWQLCLCCHGAKLSVQGSGQQPLQRALLHATERGFLGDSLTKISYKNEVSGFLSLASGHSVWEGGGTEYPWNSPQMGKEGEQRLQGCCALLSIGCCSRVGEKGWAVLLVSRGRLCLDSSSLSCCWATQRVRAGLCTLPVLPDLPPASTHRSCPTFQSQTYFTPRLCHSCLNVLYESVQWENHLQLPEYVFHWRSSAWNLEYKT